LQGGKTALAGPLAWQQSGDEPAWPEGKPIEARTRSARDADETPGASAGREWLLE
jgi:hypothetical protein